MSLKDIMAVIASIAYAIIMFVTFFVLFQIASIGNFLALLGSILVAFVFLDALYNILVWICK